MSFVSVEFIVFSLIVIPLYFLAPARWRVGLLLIASLVFYGFSGMPGLIVLLVTTLADFLLARGIQRATLPATRDRLLWVSLIMNVGALIAVQGFGVLAVLGISFFTFTRIAYMLDVHRRKVPAEADALTFFAFVTHFPNVVSGPIERANHLIPQLTARAGFDPDRAVEGLRLILWGAFKKVVIADRLAVYVNAVYDSPHGHQGWTLITATLFLAFQVYADFSAYTDMARGVARVIGIDLFENFRQPYLARSILDFWRRWHISLTTWIREYLFFPLSRFLLTRTKRRYPRAIEVTAYLIIMSLVGLWHGAQWTFLIWGLLHGAYMAAETVLNARRIALVPKNRLTDLLKILTMFALVAFTWIFFRAASLDDAGYILANLFSFGGDYAASFRVYGRLTPEAALGIALAGIATLIITDWIDSRWGLFTLFNRAPGGVRFGMYYGLTACIVISLILSARVQEFVYFQF
jgi:alginate O-acetyltransferase complex protein AlgI